MIIPLAAGTTFPMTDKGSIIRAQVYKAFEKDIEDTYCELEDGRDGNLDLDLQSLNEYLLELGQQIIGTQLFDTHTDFFRAGMNSLQAMQMRGTIVKQLYLGGKGKKPTSNVVYENENVSILAKNLFGLRWSQKIGLEAPIAAMKGLIKKYSVFDMHTPNHDPEPQRHTVVRSDIHCKEAPANHAIRFSREQQEALAPIYWASSFVETMWRGFTASSEGNSPSPASKRQCRNEASHCSIHLNSLLSLTCDLSRPKLDIDPSTYPTLLCTTTLIIHCTWSVNFQLGLSSFEPDIAGVHNLIQLSLTGHLPRPSRLLFCSSMAAALGTPIPALITETHIEDLSHASPIGYGRSKLVSEHIVQAAVDNAGGRATVLRIGQVVGDTKIGIWNDNEAIPMIIKSALTMKTLPELHMLCDWLPVDTLATTILDLAGMPSLPLRGRKRRNDGSISNNHPATNDNDASAMQDQLVYNIHSPHSFSWTQDLLPALSTTTLSFSPVPTSTWLAQSRSLSSSSSTTTHPTSNIAASDPHLNPALKLLDYFESSSGALKNSEARLEFEIKCAQRDSPTLQRWKTGILKSGLLNKMVAAWMTK